jgi:hypothetical protein
MTMDSVDVVVGPDPTTAIAPLTITADIQPAVNAALWQNHVPVLTGLRAEPDAPIGDITLDLTCEPPVIRPRSWHVQALGAGQVRILDDLSVDLDGDMLAAITEAARATATFTASRRGTAEHLGELRCDFRLLTRNEWGGSAAVPDILAAFV